MIDIQDEKWNGRDTLSGASALVGGDPYELRILAANTPSNATVSDEDKSAGVSISIASSENGLVRIRIASPHSRTVRWNIEFAPK
jgi:hypothetical protein